MIKLNDIRVLRNILGDKYEDDKEFTLPKYEPKKLNWGGWTMPKLSSKFLSKDKWSWNEKLGKLEVYDTSTPEIPASYYTPTEKVSTPFTADTKAAEFAAAALAAETPEVEQKTRTRAKAEESELAKRNTALAQQLKFMEDYRNLREQEAALEWATSPEGLRMAGEERIEKARKQREAAEIGRIGKSAYEAKTQATYLKSQMEYAKAQQLAEAKAQELEGARGLVKFEQSAFGQFLKGPWTKTAGKAVENIGQNLGGSIIGPFSDPGASSKLRQAILNKAAYMDLIRRRYQNKSPPITISNENDILAIGTATERKRLVDLNRAVERAQTGVAATGFLSGASGKTIIGRARRTPQLQPFTQVGYGSVGYGAFSPEAYGKLGVTQSLTSLSPGAKWDALLGRGSAAGESSDRITRILGRKPDPEGVGDKLKRFTRMKRFL